MVIRPATFKDVRNFKIRNDDLDEIHDFGGQGLKQNYSLSKECWSFIYKRETISLAGYAPVYNGALIWILIADGVTSLPVSFFKESRKYVQYLLDKYGYLENYAEIHKDFIIKWARSMGFTIDAPIQLPQGMYCKVWIRR